MWGAHAPRHLPNPGNWPRSRRRVGTFWSGIDSAISRFIVLSSARRTAAPDKEERDALDLLLMG
jgi:hypothetical protein